MGEIMKMPEQPAEMTVPEAVALRMQQMAEAMQAMAAMVRATTESMEALRQQVRLLEKVTPAQASALNARIRERAADLCRIYRIEGREKAVAARIRADLRLKFGAATVRELPRCDYESACQQLKLWDDYRALKKMREG